MNSPPESFTAKYGNCRNISIDQQLELGSDDHISWCLLKLTSDATTLALNQGGHFSLRVSGAYLSAFEPRAFAYWCQETPKDYVIACTSGTSATIRQILTDADFQSLIPSDFIAVPKLRAEDVTALAVSLTLMTILYHEVAHVSRFHLPYLVEKERDDPVGLPTARGLCEADADKWASYLIAPELLAQANGIRRSLILPVSEEIVLREVLTLYGIALHLWFTFYNQMDLPISSIYPHPLIRSTRIAIGVVDNLPTDRETVESIAIDRAASILHGLTAVELTPQRSESTQQHPFELSQELNDINDRYFDIQRTLNPALQKVRSKWGDPGETI